MPNRDVPNRPACTRLDLYFVESCQHLAFLDSVALSNRKARYDPSVSVLNLLEILSTFTIPDATKLTQSKAELDSFEMKMHKEE